MNANTITLELVFDIGVEVEIVGKALNFDVE
jgi:hypothetical protein